MQSGNNIHVQQHKTNMINEEWNKTQNDAPFVAFYHMRAMINEEWNKTQNDAPFVAFYDMRAVTFVLPEEMAAVPITGLQWFILIP